MRVIDKDGKLINSYTRPGRGPGEILLSPVGANDTTGTFIADIPMNNNDYPKLVNYRKEAVSSLIMTG